MTLKHTGQWDQHTTIYLVLYTLTRRGGVGYELSQQQLHWDPKAAPSTTTTRSHQQPSTNLDSRRCMEESCSCVLLLYWQPYGKPFVTKFNRYRCQPHVVGKSTACSYVDVAGRLTSRLRRRICHGMSTSPSCWDVDISQRTVGAAAKARHACSAQPFFSTWCCYLYLVLVTENGSQPSKSTISVLCCFSEHRQQVDFTPEDGKTRLKCIVDAVRLVFSDVLGTDSKLILQIKREKWKGEYVDIGDADNITNESVVRVIVKEEQSKVSDFFLCS